MALNANGNQLHPTDGDRQSHDIYDTIRVAGELEVKTLVCMSGLPGGAAGEKIPNWIVPSWPPETQNILRYQWDDVLLPYWHSLAKHADARGVRLAVEIHGNQVVYNVPTMLRLRKKIGATVGANLDPSHLMWMGADPLAAIDVLGDTPGPAPYVDAGLVEVISRAQHWLKLLTTGGHQTIAALARHLSVDDGEISRILPLAFLAPDIVAAIRAGRQPVELTARRLIHLKPFPALWTDQRLALGFPQA